MIASGDFASPETALRATVLGLVENHQRWPPRLERKVDEGAEKKLHELARVAQRYRRAHSFSRRRGRGRLALLPGCNSSLAALDQPFGGRSRDWPPPFGLAPDLRPQSAEARHVDSCATSS